VASPISGQKTNTPPSPISPPSPPVARQIAPTAPHIEVSEAASGISAAAEEAAILYANNQSQAAIDVLLQGICEAGMPKQHVLDAWFMLFDLFQAEGMKLEFEKLALDFVMQFERSAPSWREAGGESAAVATEAKKTTAVTVAIGGILTDKSRAPLDEAAGKLLKGGAQGVVLRLDFAKLQKIEPYGCRSLLAFFKKFSKAHGKLSFAGLPQLQKLLETAMKLPPGTATRDMWLLQLELLQLQGMQETFENLAMDYIVAFEESPPSWETVTKDVPLAELSDPGETATDTGFADDSEEKLILNGEIVGASAEQVKEFADYAATRERIVVDMHQVKRIDFIGAGMLLNAFTDTQRKGKKIVIVGANALIVALFHVVGATPFIHLVRDKQH